MLSKSTTSVLESVSSIKDMTIGLLFKDQPDQDKDKDCILVLKESLRTRTNITGQCCGIKVAESSGSRRTHRTSSYPWVLPGSQELFPMTWMMEKRLAFL